MFTDFTVAVPILTDLSSYFSESSVVVLGSVGLYVKYYFCIIRSMYGRNPHYAGGRYKRAIILYWHDAAANRDLAQRSL